MWMDGWMDGWLLRVSSQICTAQIRIKRIPHGHNCEGALIEPCLWNILSSFSREAILLASK